MKKYVVLEKKVGETPLSCAEAWRTANSVSLSVPLAYAGRLDPMASGKLIVLIGDECKRQKLYHSFTKEYRFEILFGFRSDTGDTLGIASRAQHIPVITAKELTRMLPEILGTHTFKYPRFSSKTVRGVPLHTWTLRGGLEDNDIPTYEAIIKNIHLDSIRTVVAHDLLSDITSRINVIPPVQDEKKALGSDFRRGEIIPRWNSLLIDNDTYTIATLTTIVSAGAYIRTLAPFIAEQLGTYGLAYSIHRTTIGTYLPLWKHYGIWLRTLR